MSSNPLFVPDLPMPPGRAETRRVALRREIQAGPAPHRRMTGAGFRWKVAVPALAAGAVAAAFAISTLTTHRASLTASWTAIPTALSSDDSARVQQQCQAQLQAQHWPISVSAMTGVLAERRGQLTAVLLSGADEYGVCIGDPGSPLFSGIGMVGPFARAGGLVLDGNPGKLNGSDPFRVAYGQVAPSVTSVVIDTADGRHVDATVDGGRFFAWWPSGADPKSITAFAADGSVVRTLNPPPSELSPTPVHRPGTA
jgi:hypothetical protein